MYIIVAVSFTEQLVIVLFWRESVSLFISVPLRSFVWFLNFLLLYLFFLAWNCNFAIALRFNIGSNGLQGLQFGQLPQAIRAFLDTRKEHTCEPL
jgi:hypothetical protein